MRLDASRRGAESNGTPELEEHVLQAHDAETHRAPLGVGDPGLVGGVVVDVDDPVEERHDLADGGAETLVVDGGPVGAVDDEGAEVQRAEVADRGLGLAGHLEDLGAEVRQVHDPGLPSASAGAGLVALGVGRVLERHPAVAGLGQRPHHAAVELAGRDLTLEQASFFGFGVGRFELGPEEIDEVRDLLGVEQRPLPVVLDALHEQVGNPVRDVEVVGAPSGFAGVLLEIEELLDVGVPALEVHACRALAATALVDRGHGAVEGLEPRDDAVGQPVGALDEAALGAHPMPGHADAAGELREAGDVGVALVDALERVLGRVEQVAARHLGVCGAGVEQGGARWQVGQR